MNEKTIKIRDVWRHIDFYFEKEDEEQYGCFYLYALDKDREEDVFLAMSLEDAKQLRDYIDLYIMPINKEYTDQIKKDNR